MKLRFLGTSAGELYPGIWCQCRNCESARNGDSRDRRQSAALYIELAESDGSGVLIDFPPEIASQALIHRVPLARLQHLLMTHSHGDHWFPYQLRWRSGPRQIVADGGSPPVEAGAPRFTELARLHIGGNAAVESVLRRELGEYLEPFGIEYHGVSAGVPYQSGPMTVMPVAANHDVGREDALHFILKNAGRTILYGLDGDTFLPETREALRSYRFDAVIMESTSGYGDGKNHRNFARLIADADWLRDEGLLTPNGQILATHFSPHHCPLHAETAAYLAKRDIVAAFDGMEVVL